MENNTNKTSHQSILKATGVFGFLHVFKLMISVVSSKFVAIFLGPAGIGLLSLFTNAIGLIAAFTNFEFLKTGTREIALNSLDTNTKLTKAIQNLNRLAIVIGVFGALITLLFSKYLSQFTFGNSDKQNWFYYLGFYFIIVAYSNARMAILQGVNQIKKLAWCNIIIAFFTAIGTIIIYFFLRIEGIVWVVLYASFVTLLVTIYFTKQYSFKFNFSNFKDFYNESSPVVKLGFIMSANLILGQISFFIIRTYLNDDGNSFNILGFYEVNTVIIVNYLGLIFNAMSYDFYPKLTAISSDNKKVKELVNSQMEIAILLVTPAIVFLYIFAPLLIRLLYTKEFLATFTILKLALFSVILKAILMPLGYLILAKGDKKQYFKQELFSDFLNVVLTIVLYKYFGLLGIGLAFIINYILYGLYIYKVVKDKYEFTYYKSNINLIVVNMLIGVISIIIIFSTATYWTYILLSVVFIFSVYYSFTELNKRVAVLDFIKNKFKKFKK
jgi:O-antigen/teichoic acid export membrane protein